mmetsp:Transcript_12167/g.25701  ORF Transcript_12167/g.25701 Transcript_12167/m.25701 type:complete len:317 (+) Transcript_12167:1519-2469(+)
MLQGGIAGQSGAQTRPREGALGGAWTGKCGSARSRHRPYGALGGARSRGRGDAHALGAARPGGNARGRSAQGADALGSVRSGRLEATLAAQVPSLRTLPGATRVGRHGSTCRAGRTTSNALGRAGSPLRRGKAMVAEGPPVLYATFCLPIVKLGVRLSLSEVDIFVVVFHNLEVVFMVLIIHFRNVSLLRAEVANPLRGGDLERQLLWPVIHFRKKVPLLRGEVPNPLQGGTLEGKLICLIIHFRNMVPLLRAEVDGSLRGGALERQLFGPSIRSRDHVSLLRAKVGRSLREGAFERKLLCPQRGLRTTIFLWSTL